VTGITEPLICNATRAGVERREPDRVASPGGQQAFMVRKQAPASDAAPVTSPRAANGPPERSRYLVNAVVYSAAD
jgi:hypothetical protein